MTGLRALLDRAAHHFEPGGRLDRLYPLWEAADSFFYTPPSVAAAACTCATRST